METLAVYMTPVEDGEISDSQHTSNLVHFNDIFEILYYRYGFVLNESGSADNDFSENTIHETRTKNDWRLLTRIIASNAATTPDVMKPVSLAVEFLAMFFQKGRVPNPTMQDTWDLSRRSSVPLHIVIDKSVLRIAREGNRTGLYTISPGEQQGEIFNWMLTLRDPTTVLEILRRNLGPSIESIVNFLVHSGIPFNTAMSSNTYPPPPRCRLSPFLGLGMRLRNFIPDAEEYRLYEEARDDFLRGPFGRAALLKGGIIWRLAKSVVSIHDVFNGPTQLARDYGQLVSSEGDDMIDDDLSDEQLDLISGLYRISHGDNVKQGTGLPVARHGSGTGYGRYGTARLPQERQEIGRALYLTKEKHQY
ncbi:hypothetical protein APHAL10511_004740 [Amanita phalloides]|nr:hypothetical protein APHAL10511_004740 [Amanita phalloides]